MDENLWLVWFGQWLGDACWRSVAWANIDPDVYAAAWRHQAAMSWINMMLISSCLYDLTNSMAWMITRVLIWPGAVTSINHASLLVSGYQGTNSTVIKNADKSAPENLMAWWFYASIHFVNRWCYAPWTLEQVYWRCHGLPRSQRYIIWYDMKRYAMLCCDMIWYDMIWYDMMWYDMIWYGLPQSQRYY